MEPEKTFEDWYRNVTDPKIKPKSDWKRVTWPDVKNTDHGESAMQAFRDHEERIEECAQMLARKYGQPDEWEAFVDIVRAVEEFMR